MKLRHLLSLTIGACVAAGAIAQPRNLATEQIQAQLKATINNCAVCHGLHGHSVSPTFPNLAAQQPIYIENQLKAFRGQTRDDPDAQAYMWGMASSLSDAMIGELAHYWSIQPPPPPVSGNAKLIAAGRAIFTKGIAAEGVPPCASCHGPEAAGRGMFPRLAGQHQEYLLKQLLVIQSALRSAPVMHGIIKDLNRSQMLAVTTYLASL